MVMKGIMRKQAGVIPAIVIVALVLSALVGGLIGFQLGDGTFFSFGVGFGLVFVILLFLSPHLESLTKLIKKNRKR